MYIYILDYDHISLMNYGILRYEIYKGFVTADGSFYALLGVYYYAYQDMHWAFIQNVRKCLCKNPSLIVTIISTRHT